MHTEAGAAIYLAAKKGVIIPERKKFSECSECNMSAAMHICLTLRKGVQLQPVDL
jgi:hypothetical protein